MPIQSAINVTPVTFAGQQARYPQPLTPDELPQGETVLPYSRLTLTKTGTVISTAVSYDNPVVKDPGKLALTQPLMERMLGGPLPSAIPTATVSPARQVTKAQSPTILPQPSVLPVPKPSSNRLTPNSVQRLSPISPVILPVISVVPQVNNRLPLLAIEGSGNTIQAIPVEGKVPAVLSSVASTVNLPVTNRFDSHLWSQQRAGQVVGLAPAQVPQLWDQATSPDATGERRRAMSDGGQAFSGANDKANQQANGRFRPAIATVAPLLAGKPNALDLLNPALYKTVSPNPSGWQA